MSIRFDGRRLFVGDEEMEEVLSEYWSEYRKKPVVIKAIQMEGSFRVETLEGTMEGQEGDWLIEGINGELYPCKPDIFEESYEKV